MKKLIILAHLILMLPLMSVAQNELRYKVNMALLQAIDDYENTLNLSEEKYSTFIGQFESLNTPVYNDLLGLSFSQNLTAEQYGRLLVNANHLFNVKLLDVKAGEISQSPDGWEVPVRFSKEVEYTDDRGVLFSSTEFYGKYYDIVVNYVYDENQDRCYIKSISGSVDSDKRLPENYIVVQRPEGNKYRTRVYDKVIYQDTTLSYNRANQTFLPANLSTKGFYPDLKTWEDDTFIRQVRDKQTGMTRLKANRKTGRFKMRFGTTIGNAFKVDNASDYSDVKSRSMEYGVDLGLVFSSTKVTRFGLFIGAALNESSMQFINDTVQLSVTTNGAFRTYNRMLDQKQEFSFSDISFQAYMNFEHRVIDRLSINWSLGMRAYLNQDYKLGNYDVVLSTAEQSLDENGELYEIETNRNPLHFTSFSEDNGMMDFKSLSLSAIGTLGVNAFVTRSISVNAKFGYELGIDDYNSFTNNSRSYKNLLIDANGIVATRPFVYNFNAKRQGVWFEAGITFKFF